jgi:DNA polymerase-3 subunit delta
MRQGTTAMTPADFRQALRKGKKYDIVLLRGNEEFLLREVLDEYIRVVMDPAAVDFDYSELRGQEVDGRTLWNALTTLPLLAERRVVVLDASSDLKADAVESLGLYTKHPASTTALILIQVTDGRDDKLGGLPGNVASVEFRELKDQERAVWAVEYAKKSGKVLGEEGVQYLIETSSRSLFDLASKLDHAILYAGEAPDISVQILMKVSGISSEYTVFNLEDAILKQQPVEALRIARSLLEGGEALLRLIATHRGFLLRLWQISSAMEKQKKGRKVGEADQLYETILKRQIFKLSQFKRAAQQMGAVRTRRAVQGLLELEILAKSGSQEPYRYYEWLWNLGTSGRISKEPWF